jgi:hypothetical protein
MSAIEREQAALDRLLPEILPEHRGEFVVMHNGEPVEYFASYNEAYRTALSRFGLDETFLVSEVIERDEGPVSISWYAGVMFG